MKQDGKETNTKKIDTRKNGRIWRGVKEYFGLIEASDPDEEEAKFKHLRKYLDDYSDEHLLLKHNGYMMQPSAESPIVYEQINKFSDFLDDLFRDHKYKEAYKGVSTKDNLIKYLENNHVDIHLLKDKTDRNVIAFKNGYIKLDTLEFVYYKANATSLDYDFTAKKFLNFELDPELLKNHWSDIKCPIFDKLINDQPHISEDPVVKMVFYGLHGSLHYPVQADSIDACICNYGASGSGKSQVSNIVSATFSEEAIGTINSKESVFGKTAFLTKEVIIDNDVPDNMVINFGKTFFQKCVSGEIVPIPVKYQKSEELVQITQRMLINSQYRQNVADTGEIARRIVYFSFQPVDQTIGNLSENCIATELHLCLIKMLLARKAMLAKFGNKPFFEWDIPYFEDGRDGVLLQNNLIWKTIDANPDLRMRKDGKYDFNLFKDRFREICEDKKKKLTVDDAMFIKMKLHVMPHKICKECKKANTRNCCPLYSKFNTKTQYFIHGLQCIDEANLIENDSDGDDLPP